MGGEFGDHVREMLRSWVLIVVVSALAGAGMWAWRSSTPALYTSTTVAQVVVQPSDRSDDGTITEFRSRTLAELATTPAILDPAIARSGLSIDTAEAADRIRVELLDSTGFIEVSAEGPTPADAVALSDAVVASLSTAVANDRELFSSDELRIVEPAQAPTSPESSRSVELAVLAALTAALVVAEATVAVRVLRGKLSPVDAASDLERATGVPTLDLRRSGGEAAFFRKHLASLPVITAFTAEGADVRFVVDLARMSAGIHDRVLLIDGDQDEPRLHSHLGLVRSPGLSEFADGEVPLGQAVQPGPAGGRIAVLTSGSARSTSSTSHRRAIEHAIEISGADQSIVVGNAHGNEFTAVEALSGTAAPVVLVFDVAVGDRRAVIRRVSKARRIGFGLAAVFLVDTESGRNR